MSKVDLMNVYDFGVPINPDSRGMNAIVLYNVIKSLPSDEGFARAVRRAEGSTAANNASPPPLLSVNAVTESCDTTNNLGNMRQCLIEPHLGRGTISELSRRGGGAWGQTLLEHVG
jgi:hypothetical protein